VWAAAEYIGVSMESSTQVKMDWNVNPETGYALPFDLLVPPNVLVELDGAQHFRQVSNWTDPEITAARDVLKETMALAAGFSVVRLLTQHVRDDSTDWQRYLRGQIAEAIKAPMPRVYTPRDTVEYTTGIYARLHQ
jgi:hypothetical protein